jgi:hypothetical protein
MRQRILFSCLCVLFLSFGCRTPKKIVGSTSETITGNEKQSETASSETYNFADTTKKQDVEINWFKVDFYPPETEDRPETIPDNSTLNLLDNIGSSKQKKPPNNKGAIKSIEGYTVKAKSEQAGVNESRENAQVNKKAEKNEDINRQAEIKEQPAPDPYRWRYIFYILVLLAAVLLYFKRIPVLNWIKKILSNIRRIF